MERKTYSDYEHPAYNIKAVAQMIGLLPVTLRAWERRYGLPNPVRGGQGYRLYSEHDLQTLRWLKSQIDTGMNIGQAARKLSQLRDSGMDPAAKETTSIEKPLSPDNLREQVLQSLYQFNDGAAAEAMRQAFSLYTTEQVFGGIIEPALVEIGNAWEKGTLPVAAEHYCSQFFQEQLVGILAVSPQPFRSGLIVAGCLPGEYHQIGLLMLVILLRMRGWNVIYLGPNLSMDRLDEVLNPLRPKLLLFSSTMSESAKSVVQLPEMIKKLSILTPLVVLGGKGFANLKNGNDAGYPILGSSPLEQIKKIEELMETRNP